MNERWKRDIALFLGSSDHFPLWVNARSVRDQLVYHPEDTIRNHDDIFRLFAGNDSDLFDFSFCRGMG